MKELAIKPVAQRDIMDYKFVKGLQRMLAAFKSSSLLHVPEAVVCQLK
jgi:hypothetical protein